MHQAEIQASPFASEVKCEQMAVAQRDRAGEKNGKAWASEHPNHCDCILLLTGASGALQRRGGGGGGGGSGVLGGRGWHRLRQTCESSGEALERKMIGGSSTLSLTHTRLDSGHNGAAWHPCD